MDDLLDTAPCGSLSFADDGTITLANSTLAMVGHDRDSLPRPEPREDADGRGPGLLPDALLPAPEAPGVAEEVYLTLRTSGGGEARSS
jgi:sigma-B regulation protein RsbU (phosphoserine phosphatase)